MKFAAGLIALLPLVVVHGASISLEKRSLKLNSQHIDTLIIVPCNSIYNGSSFTNNQVDKENNWFLYDYQHGLVPEFINHMKVGIHMTKQLLGKSLLVFSGGQTRKPVGPQSEAQSYWYVADRGLGWFGEREVAAYATTEEFALDSFQNIFFSICRFYEVTGAILFFVVL
jgi:hypothetical protein